MPLLRVHVYTHAHNRAMNLHNNRQQHSYIFYHAIDLFSHLRHSPIARYAYLLAIIDHLPSAWNFNPSYERLVKFHEYLCFSRREREREESFYRVFSLDPM